MAVGWTGTDVQVKLMPWGCGVWPACELSCPVSVFVAADRRIMAAWRGRAHWIVWTLGYNATWPNAVSTYSSEHAEDLS